LLIGIRTCRQTTMAVFTLYSAQPLALWLHASGLSGSGRRIRPINALQPRAARMCPKHKHRRWRLAPKAAHSDACGTLRTRQACPTAVSPSRPIQRAQPTFCRQTYSSREQDFTHEDLPQRVDAFGVRQDPAGPPFLAATTDRTLRDTDGPHASSRYSTNASVFAAAQRSIHLCSAAADVAKHRCRAHPQAPHRATAHAVGPGEGLTQENPENSLYGSAWREPKPATDLRNFSPSSGTIPLLTHAIYYRFVIFCST
jgi:hypothetical protein